jgi:methylase of polypeptide subunit release factors
MSRWLIGGVVVLAALAVTLRPAEPVMAVPPEEQSFGKDAALRVICKGVPTGYFLSRPSAVRVGDRAFLYGWRIDADAAVYIPVSDIDLIEEYASVERLKKVYSVGSPPMAGPAAGKK